MFLINPYIFGKTLKTGFFNKMTDIVTPAYVITSSTTLYFLDSWRLFEDNWSNRATININVGATHWVQQDLLTAKIIPRKIKVERYYYHTSSATGTITIEVSADGSNWINFGSISTAKGSGYSQTLYEIVNTTITTQIRYLRMKITNNGSHTQYDFNECQIIEWLE